jgi:putative ABC transport system permease protein
LTFDALLSCARIGRMRDIRYAVRSLARSPRFTLAALLALGLGIGAATTVFSVADGLLFRQLPYHDPDRLVSVSAAIRSRDLTNWAVRAEEFDAWRTSTRTLSDLAGHLQRGGPLTLMSPGEPQDVAAAAVTEGFLHTLGVAPVVGREFNATEFIPGAPRAILLTDQAWRRIFHADPAVIGKPIVANGEPAQIVGILPKTFAYPSGDARLAPEVLIPYVRNASARQPGLLMVGRLAPGVTVEQARTELDGIAAARKGETSLRNATIDGATVLPLSTALVAPSQADLMRLLVGAVAALLLIGCANVANLLVARGTDRRSELGLRAALGATRASLIRLLLVESAVLAAAGGTLGLVLAMWAITIVGPLIPEDLKLLKEIVIDSRALAATTGVSMLCVILSGLAPAVRLARTDATALSGTSHRATSNRVRTGQIVVGLEVALAIVLLVGGALMTHAMVRLLRIDHGYDATGVLTMRVQMARTGELPTGSPAFVEKVLAAVRAVPGVTLAGAMAGSPLDRTVYGGIYTVEGFSRELMRQDAAVGGVCCTQSPEISADYLAALGVPVVRGRGFTAGDAARSPRVALINEKLARKFPPGVDPVGHFLVSGQPGDRREIVGVVRDIRDLRLEDQPMQAIYLPLEEAGAAGLTIVMRTAGNAGAVAAAAPKAVQQSAGPVVISNVRTLDELLMRSISPRRLNAWLFGSFGLLGLLLAATGIYGVISYAVAQRMREMGVRLALGARPGQLKQLVITQMSIPVLTGLAAGLAISGGLSRYISSLLYETSARDLPTYAVVCAVLVSAALAAAYLPARRASQVDPMIALRSE